MKRPLACSVEALMSEVTMLLLARHGQTDWHHDNRYAGADSDIDLTDVGRAQAQALAVFAMQRRPAAVISSPVRRALETARPAAAALGTALEIVEDLREVGFGVAEGRTAAELDDLDPAIMRRFRSDPVAHPFPGAEPPEAAAKRAADSLRAVADRFRGATVLVVAHNTVLRLAMCALLDLPIGRYRQIFPRLDNGAVTALRIPDGHAGLASLLSLNTPLTP
jgi:broad specificity phosphatase PhoE